MTGRCCMVLLSAFLPPAVVPRPGYSGVSGIARRSTIRRMYSSLQCPDLNIRVQLDRQRQQSCFELDGLAAHMVVPPPPPPPQKLLYLKGLGYHFWSFLIYHGDISRLPQAQ